MLRDVANKGFSLIEMLVALVVLSLSLGVLYQAAAGATRNVRVAAEYTEAVMLAESKLVEHSYITEESYSASGEFGEYSWSVSSWPAVYENVTSPDQMPLLPRPLQYLEVIVSWAGGSDKRSLDLLTVVPLRSPLP
jgi:general secretion pathway protein I